VHKRVFRCFLTERLALHGTKEYRILKIYKKVMCRINKIPKCIKIFKWSICLLNSVCG